MSRPLQWAKSLRDILAKFKAKTLGDMEPTTLIDTMADTLAETETDTNGETLGDTLPDGGTDGGTDMPCDTLVDVKTITLVDTLVLR